MEWYYILGIISYSIFLIQFGLSFVGGDTELDVDLDGATDFCISDLVSFKGLIHFLMGFSGWLMVTRSVSILSIIFAICVGICFVLVLYFVYKLILRLQYIPERKSGLELVGSTVTIYLTLEHISNKHCICIIQNGGIPEELTCIAASPVRTSDKRVILDYKNNIYYIS